MAESNFWTDTLNPTDPKRNFRFRVTIGGDTIWWAKDVDQPEATVSAAEHDFMQHKFYFPGKVTWNEISMTLVDPVSPGALDSLFRKLSGAGYKIPGNINDPTAFTSISKAASNVALGEIVIQVLEAGGNTVHEWRLNNSFMIKITSSKLDYATEDLMQITLSVKYDWASYTGLDSGGTLFTTNDANQTPTAEEAGQSLFGGQNNS